MASHHHCHYPHPPTAAPNPASYSCHCCYTSYSSCQHHHPPPAPPPDPYLHHPPHQPHTYPPLSRIPNFPQYPEQFQEPYFREGRQHHPTVSSLLLRIAALESALSRRSSHASPSQSLRSAAARTIQAHFRAFLLRRSITLRQLKDLAAIKSNLGVLKSSVSGKTHFDYEVVYHKAMNLLMNLDAIKGGDPLIRNGKSSLSRELNNFLDFLEGACVQRRALSIGVNVRQGDNVPSRVSDSGRKIGNVKSGCLKRVNLEKLRGLVERIDRLTEEIDGEQNETIKSSSDDLMIRNVYVSTNRTGGLLKQHGGVQPKVKKTGSFVENGRVYNVLRGCCEMNLEESKNDGDDLVGDLVERIDRLTEEIDEKQNEAIKGPNNDLMIRNVDVSTNRTGCLLKQHGGVQPKVKKTVSFVENGRVYNVLRRRSEPNVGECNNDGDDLVGDDELDDDLCRDIGVSRTNDVEEEDEEDSLISSDGERDSRGYPATEENYEMTRHDADDFIFSAPVPVRMESRGNSNEKRRN